MVRIRATTNLTSDRLRKSLKKNTLIMGEEAEVPEDVSQWLIEKGYAETVTDKVAPEQDDANLPPEKAPKTKKGEPPAGSVDVDAEQKEADAARAARLKAAKANK